MTRRFKNALFTESGGFCRSFYSLNLRVLILISLVTSLPSQGLAGGLSEVIEGVGVDLSYCFVLSTGCLQCAEYYLAPVKTTGQINKKFASRVAGRQNALRACPAGRTQQESGLAPSARLSDWSAG